MKLKFTAALLLTLLVAGCGGSPGQLEGTWRADAMPMTITFRPGETETMGVIERVDYATKGNVVKVTYKDGLMKGSSINFVIQDPNTATNPMYTLRRIR
ncbi:hypothetical protein [Massilia suwonensis]|uniref:Lipocalin-like domain-containing protein n=1 Tax=Massilia suwonensis TaxID=648895 RepID=A0ABW0MEG0_9BURK